MKIKLTGNSSWISCLPFGRINIVPILSKFLISAKDGEITVTGLTSQSQTIISLQGEIEEEGECCVEGKIFARIMSSFSAKKEIYIETKTNEKERIAGQSDDDVPIIGKLIAKQDNSEFELYASDTSLYPEDNRTKKYGAVIETSILNLLEIQKVASVCVDKQMSRPVFSGIAIKTNEKGLFVWSTDGIKIARLFYPGEYENCEAILPPEMFDPFRSNLFSPSEKAKIKISEKSIAIETNCISISGATLLYKYPDMEKAIEGLSKEFFPIHFTSSEINKAFNNAKMFVEDVINRVDMRINKNEVIISACSKITGASRNVINCENEKEIEEYTISFNIMNIAEMIKIIETEKISILMPKENTNAILIKNCPDVEGREISMYLMPLRPKK